MSDFPVIRVTGGPHAKNTEVTVDGQRPPKVSRVEITLDVNDVVRVKTFQMAEAQVDITGLHEDGGVSLALVYVWSRKHEGESREPWWERAYEPILTVTAPTVREALEKALEELPIEEVRPE